MSAIMLFPILFPIAAGILLLMMKQPKSRKVLLCIVGVSLLVTGALVLFTLMNGSEEGYTLFYITDTLPIYFKPDALGKMFAVVVVIVWICAGFFSFSYMEHENWEKRFYGFYLIVFGVLIGLDFSGNIITFYLFYELMTLTSLPLVLHTRTKESVMAGLKYLFYSFCGAYMVLFGIYFLNRYAATLSFTPGGVLDMAKINGNEGFLLIVIFIMIIGFGVKSGMFPLHAWLPLAHPVAPAPASAALSGIIVKGGILGVIRVIFYLFGADFIKGTWVQTVWMSLALLTVFMGSMLAYREKILKKRLAYSTISQLSYILFGIALLESTAMTGALIHVVFHAFIKCTLFLTAGAIIHKTGKTKVDELTGIGKEMPITMWCYTFASLALIGIPPTSGFISKWYLAVGSLESGIAVFSWLGPVILLISALLTAGYLLPLVLKGFFPGEDYVTKEGQKGSKREASYYMLIPLILLAVLTVVLGMLPNPIISWASSIAAELL